MSDFLQDLGVGKAVQDLLNGDYVADYDADRAGRLRWGTHCIEGAATAVRKHAKSRGHRVSLKEIDGPPEHAPRLLATVYPGLSDEMAKSAYEAREQELDTWKQVERQAGELRHLITTSDDLIGHLEDVRTRQYINEVVS